MVLREDSEILRAEVVVSKFCEFFDLFLAQIVLAFVGPHVVYKL